jgi:hypothetical protein
MARLEHLGRRAEEKNMLGVAMRAEELRGKVAGYYVDRQVIKQDNMNDMSEEEIAAKMKQIADDYKLILEDKNEVEQKSDD